MTDFQKTCQNCYCSFEAKRKDKKFCSTKCRKLSSQKAIREKSPINAANNPSKRRETAVAFDKALRWAEIYYAMPPADRPAFLDELLELAKKRVPFVGTILGMPALLRASPQDKHLFYRRIPGSHRTISQLMHDHCKEKFGVSFKHWLKGQNATK